jgi:hypothetical protein
MEKTHKEKLRDAGIARYGSEEAWREAKREHGAKADRSTPRGFAKMEKEQQIEISKKGGRARWDKQKAIKKDQISEADELS